MRLFKDGIKPCCALCKHAKEYIPYWTYPYNDPYCILGHGKCYEDKSCGDFELLGRNAR